MLKKLDQIRQKLSKEGLDAFLFSSYSNIFYLSRFSSSNAYIILTQKDIYFLTDARYYQNAKEKLTSFTVVELKNGLKGLKQFINDLNIKNLGFEKDKITLSFYEKLKEGITPSLYGYEGFLNEFRISKTEEEIEIIKQAVIKIDNVFKKVIPWIEENINNNLTEISVRRKIIDLIFEEGGTSESFPTIVASGKHSAIPHWETSNELIQKNAPLLIDMGLKYQGYCSDFTRTLYIGNPDEKFKEIYNIVKEAHIAATQKVKAGVPIKEIDFAARQVIEKSGYGEYFTHSTGHGIGIDIHEEPRIYKDNEEILQENTVFTIEPGIYIPGYGGVRLENIVVARKNGVEILTETPL
ncbi:Xaa-Pro peptidase family protein [Sulfurihydrogenibium sp.]|uniref:M24 family metallopeptidase n=1 Tax=Sulfurihydrogenibium sp. TaxID=2053621 RepID=UPI002603EA06|nr:Xaa-Pro peptidase family protein [Sulfurihydrogenibium sp.]